ncbi:hypothetical protein IFM89_008655 [Coptis chinensis]|uniref:Uncharacterized protein n=1 Tax=Coptis chinensis TaxID=261450 RepID=A0A835GYH1_9MAGN|nr:hypothetical protein IFM89_008655 [Coptis chinensis]
METLWCQTFGSFMWPTKSYHVKCIRDLETWVLVCLSTYVASYAILTCMIARVCGMCCSSLKPEFILSAILSLLHVPDRCDN